MTEATEDDVEEETDAAEGSDELVARIAAEDEELAGEVADLQSRIEELESELESREEEIEELESRVKRTQADFQNYKKRAKRRQEEIRERATEDLVERLLDVRDNLKRALDQDEGVDIRDGVEATLESFDRVLAEEDVAEIDPDPGEEVDPQRHEVVHRIEADVPEGTIAEVYRPGYEMAGAVIRAAQVTVSEGTDGGTEE